METVRTYSPGTGARDIEEETAGTGLVQFVEIIALFGRGGPTGIYR